MDMTEEINDDETGRQEDTGAPSAHTAAEFAELDESLAVTDPAALSMLYDLSLPVTIELGRARMTVQELLGLGRGAVIKLDRLAGEPIDVFVGDRRFADIERIEPSLDAELPQYSIK